MIQQLLNLPWQTQVALITGIVILSYIFKEIIVKYISKKFDLKEVEEIAHNFYMMGEVKELPKYEDFEKEFKSYIKYLEERKK